MGSTRQREDRRRLTAWILLLTLLAAAAFALMAYRAGQDGNWDFYNYHFYNAFAFLNDRYWFDIAPAQRQSFFSPFLDVPFYLLTQTFGVVTASLSFAAFQSLQAPAIFIIVYLVLTSLMAKRHWALALSFMLAGLSVFSPLNLLLVGETPGDNTTAVLVLWGVACVMVAQSDLVRRDSNSATALCLLAGLLGGLAVGLKLTNGPFALALLFMVLLMGGNRTDRLRLFLLVSLSSLAGFLIAYGYWGWFLYDQFQNPLFPLFNHIFQSGFTKPVQLNDETFKATTPAGVIFYPFFYNVYAGDINHQQFLDLRIPVVYTAIVIAGLAALFSPDARKRLAGSPLIAGILLFYIVSYVAWIQLFSITRYLVVLEVMAPVAVIAAACIAFRNRWAIVASAILLLAPIAFSSWQASQGGHAFGHRTPWADTVFEIRLPEIELEESMVLITGGQAMAFLIPDAPRSTRFVRIDSNLNYVGYTSIEERYSNLMGERLRLEIGSHDGDFFIIYSDGEEKYVGPDLAYFGIERQANHCHSIKSKGPPLYICQARRFR